MVEFKILTPKWLHQGVICWLFDLEFCDTSQNFSSFRQPIEKMKIKVVLSQTDAENFNGYLDKQ